MKRKTVLLMLLFMLAACFPVSAQSLANNGVLKFDKPLYLGYGVQPIVTLVDHDLNLNPAAVDKASVTITSSADQKGIVLILKETSSNTGIFTGVLKFGTSVSSSVSSTIKVSASSSIRAQYVDSATFDNHSKTIMAEAAFQFTEAAISTSAENDHGSGNMMDITIFEPDSNNPERIDTINAKIGAGTSTNDLSLRLEETGINTGEFRQTVYFTDRESNKKLLYMRGMDKVNIKYTDLTVPQGGSKEIVKSIGWDFQSTVIKLDKERYEGYNSSAEIILYNMELNDNSSEADRVYVDVNAGNSKSIRLQLKETKSNSGIFKGTLYFGKKTDVNKNRLKMEDADYFTVSYANKRNKSDVAECTADWSPQDGKLTLGRQVYYGNAAVVSVTLEDWDAAEDSSKTDDVTVIARIQGTSRKRTITLKETRRDSGVFTGTFYINGGKGKNPSIDVKAGETIEVAYTDKDTSSGSEEIRTASAVWAGISEPKLTMDLPSYKGYDSVMVITLKDLDYNRLINSRENVEVIVKTAAGGSRKYVLKETDADTGVFTATLKFSKDGVGYNYMKVGEKDTITVTFVDKNVSISAGFSNK